MKLSHSSLIAAAAAAFVIALAFVANVVVAPAAFAALAAMPVVFLANDYAKPRRGYRRDRVTRRHPLPLAV